MRISVVELKNQLSRCLRRVQQGEEIVVTSHHKPVAKLVPLSAHEQEPLLARSELAAELETLRSRLRGAIRGEPLSRTVIEGRRAERY